MSRIFQSLGEDIEKLPGLWVAAPLTGLLVQPVIGPMSDRTWLGRLGRRRPYFLGGAILAAVALFVMPESPAVWFAAVMLWLVQVEANRPSVRDQVLGARAQHEPIIRKPTAR